MNAEGTGQVRTGESRAAWIDNPQGSVPARTLLARGVRIVLRALRRTLLGIVRLVPDLVLVAIALALALGIGVATARLATGFPSPFGRVALGPWVASPLAGRAAADPYTRVRTTLGGSIPLGQAEGIAFTASSDAEGRPLVTRCDYVIEGQMPPARWWSLVPVPRETRADRPVTLHSRQIQRDREGGFVINVSARPRPGAWLALPAPPETGGAATQGQPLALTLTLYDTPVTREADLGSTVMPPVRRLGCRG